MAAKIKIYKITSDIATNTLIAVNNQAPDQIEAAEDIKKKKIVVINLDRNKIHYCWRIKPDMVFKGLDGNPIVLEDFITQYLEDLPII